MSEAGNLFSLLRQSVDGGAAAAIEELVQDAPDRALSRVNVLDFAAKTGVDQESAIAAFLHAARLGIFELSWNVLCPGCGGVLDTGTTLRSVNKEEYDCGLCAAGWEVPRLWCPFCGNRNHEQLRFIFNEGEEAKYRIAVCDGCRGYVKMISTLSALSPLHLLVADVATVHLDLACAERGYTNHF